MNRAHLLASQRERYARRNVHEAEEEDVFRGLIDELPSQGCFVNVGSAIGYYPILAKRERPDLEVHAFEPLADHRRKLRENLSLNGLNEDEVVVHREAISMKEGWSRFVSTGYGSRIVDRNLDGFVSLLREVGSLVKAMLTAIGISALGDVRFVKNVTLNNVVEEIGSPIDLVQLDVQGLEYKVLKGGDQALEAGRVHALLIGTHGRELHRDCEQLLRRHGYRIETSSPSPDGQPDGILVAQP